MKGTGRILKQPINTDKGKSFITRLVGPVCLDTFDCPPQGLGPTHQSFPEDSSVQNPFRQDLLLNLNNRSETGTCEINWRDLESKEWIFYFHHSYGRTIPNLRTGVV